MLLVEGKCKGYKYHSALDNLLTYIPDNVINMRVRLPSSDSTSSFVESLILKTPLYAPLTV